MKTFEEIRNDLKSAYDAKASEQSKTKAAWWKTKERDLFLSKFKKGRKKRILEIGCGTGADSIDFKSKGYGVTCTDLSPKNIEICRENGLNAQVMDFANLDFAPATFEGVYAMNCLLHVKKDSLENILLDINTLLRPSGLFYIGVYGGPDREGEHEDDTYEPRRFFASYTDNQIIKIVSGIFDMIYFHRIELERERLVHFQSMILRKKLGEVDPDAGDGPMTIHPKANPEQF